MSILNLAIISTKLVMNGISLATFIELMVMTALMIITLQAHIRECLLLIQRLQSHLILPIKLGLTLQLAISIGPFLAVKLGNLIKICIYDMPIELLSSYTIITEHNSFFWIIYSMIGTLLPLLIEYNYKRFVYKLKNLINYLHSTKN